MMIALPLAIIAFLVYAPIRFLKSKNKEKRAPSSVSAEEMKDGKILLCIALTLISFLLLTVLIVILLDSFWILGCIVVVLVPAISLTFFICSSIGYKKAKKKKAIDPNAVSDEEIGKKKLNLTLSLTIMCVLVMCFVVLSALYTMLMASM